MWRITFILDSDGITITHVFEGDFTHALEYALKKCFEFTISSM